MKTASGRLRLITLAAVSLLAAFYLIKTFKAGFGMSSALACQLSLLMLICTVLCLRPGWKFLKTFVPFTLWYALVPLVPLFCGVLVRSNEFMASACFGIFIFCGFFTVKELAGTIHAGGGRWYLLTFPLWIIALCLPLIFYGYGFLENAVFSGDLILTVLQTHFAEAVAYAQTAYGLKLLFLIPIILLVGYCSFVLSKPFCQLPFSFSYAYIPIILGFFCFLSAISVLSDTKGFNCLERKLISFTRFALADYREFSDSKAAALEGIKVTSGGDAPQLFVLVIGESENRDYMGVYGYPEPTTPLSSKAVSEGHLLRFNRAYSNFPHTVNALSLALTSADQYRNERLAQAFSLLQIAHKAGFKTYWISNQSKDSMVDTPITAMSMQADHSSFVRASGAYDEELLEKLPESVPDESSLIIIHLNGSHFLFKDRYPENFAKFLPSANSSSDKRVAEYKNSVLYTDYVLHKLSDKFSTDPRFMAMLYFSDHGADPTLKTDHNASHFNFEMVRIPMLLKLSDSYGQRHPQIVSTLKGHIDMCFTNDLIFDLMTGLMSIQIQGRVNGKWDLTSQDYDLSPDKAVTLHGGRKISEDKNYSENPFIETKP